MSTITNQSTQYNSIVSAYSSLYPTSGPSAFPPALLEEAQVQTALNRPDIDVRGKRVLDLACGNGYYSLRYLLWGAASVTGVDISSSMVDAACAEALKQGIPDSKLKFVVADVTDEKVYIDGGPFDIVASAWLLNYAPDTPTMTRMWDFVALHLKPGAAFVGLTIAPLHNARRGKLALEQEAAMLNITLAPDGAFGKLGNRGRVLGFVEEGLKVEIELGFKDLGQDVAMFENYYLGIESFRDSIKASRIGGSEAFEGIEWQDFVIPKELKDAHPVGRWNDMAIWPLCRVCVAKRVK
ncbi:uncharacterized protein N0V89_010652 [Didymosphaeria variabile]|uniref:Methyltransferase domain-containing protein n=1 Tax=Didymosphaeria variabile TaxID=1932322 RepID=A0A9W8XC15_9PLEO|nr:uncharacterized protein N0V89_010652 [Didymosphaeria variabile]KAJ4346720.1 hypothetical protein N0V89_010652 [Didymosphaeria variabile]